MSSRKEREDEKSPLGSIQRTFKKGLGGSKNPFGRIKKGIYLRFFFLKISARIMIAPAARRGAVRGLICSVCAEAVGLATWTFSPHMETFL